MRIVKLYSGTYYEVSDEGGAQLEHVLSLTDKRPEFLPILGRLIATKSIEGVFYPQDVKLPDGRWMCDEAKIHGKGDTYCQGHGRTILEPQTSNLIAAPTKERASEYSLEQAEVRLNELRAKKEAWLKERRMSRGKA